LHGKRDGEKDDVTINARQQAHGSRGILVAILVATCLATACSTIENVRAQAVVDESVFKAGGAGQILYVDQANAAANDNNSGTAANPFKTIDAAANAASTKTQNGTPVKIVVKPGTYREGLRVSGGTALTVIEGMNTARFLSVARRPMIGRYPRGQRSSSPMAMSFTIRRGLTNLGCGTAGHRAG
jgi:hypothetical protein